MQMAVNLREIAQAAGVTEGTVSRVLRDKRVESFPEETRIRIKEIAHRLGYRPHRAARTLATGRTEVASLCTPSPYQAFYVQVMKHLGEQAQACGYSLMTSDAEAQQPDGKPVALPIPDCDGVLAVDCGSYAERILRSCPSEQTPVVSLGTSWIPDTDRVRLELGGAFRDAARHLIAQGCRRIAHFCWLPGLTVPSEAYRAVMCEAGLPEELIFTDSVARRHARQRIVEYVCAHGCPDGILCRNDDLAIGAYRGLCDLGLEVGRDVLLVGCDGIEDTEFLSCPLSTIVAPVAELCRLGWQFLERRIADPAAPREEALLESRLEVRQSSQRMK